MDLKTSRVAPSAPIFAVEVIDAEGFAWLYGPLHLHEALKISAYFEREAEPGKDPRVSIPPKLVGVGLWDE
jgi:hypothetical protein